jgi:cytochrome c6
MEPGGAIMRFIRGARFVVGVSLLSGGVWLWARPATPQDKSASLYKQKCAACHGADGKGDTAAGKSMKVRSFSDPEVVKQTDDELAAAVDKGKNKMPAYGKSLKAEEIKGLVAYIRSLAK